jgi:hypothetical protein
MDKKIINAIRYLFDNKFELTSYLQQLGITIPERSSYSQILSLIYESGNERKFAEAVFHADSIESGIQIQDTAQGLSTMSLPELKALAQELSQHEKKWTFRKTPKAAVIRSIAGKCALPTINEAIRKLVRDDEIGFYQARKWVIGPLGMTTSVEERDTASDASIMAFLEAYFDDRISETFLDRSGLRDKVKLPVSEPLTRYDIWQLILTYLSNTKFMQLANLLISEHSLRVKSNEDYDDFSACPVGLFVRGNTIDSLDRLAEILLKYLGEADVRRDLGLPDGEVKAAIVAKLLLSKPDRVLNDLFGLGKLKQISQDVGLVGIEGFSDKQKLIEFLMFRIGFDLPASPKGIGARISSIDEMLSDLSHENATIQKGTVMSMFVELEGIIKDLICFYSIAFWKDEIEDLMNVEEVGELGGLEQFLAKKFPNLGRIKPIHKLTLGQLKSILLCLDSEAPKDATVASKTISMLSRDTILTRDQRTMLDSVSKLRSKFAHDLPEIVEPQDCLDSMGLIRKLFQSLLDDGTYPTPISVTKEITNEYGVFYFEGQDESGNVWKLKGDIPFGLCLMKAGKPPVAIDPVIAERFWSRY